MAAGNFANISALLINFYIGMEAVQMNAQVSLNKRPQIQGNSAIFLVQVLNIYTMMELA